MKTKITPFHIAIILVVIFAIFFIFATIIYFNNLSNLTKLTALTPPPPPLVVPGQTEYTINLKNGWNMFSIPVDSAKVTDIKNCNVKEIWEYSPQEKKYITPSILHPMKGYWINVLNDCQAKITGTRKPHTLFLNLGWNMISSGYTWEELNKSRSSTTCPPSSPASPAPPCAIGDPMPTCPLNVKLYHWSPNENRYLEISSTQKLDDTKGYWVEINSSCGLVESPDSVTPPAPPPFVNIKANGSNGPITLTAGSSATISWTSNNVTSCVVSPGNWTGLSGSQSSGALNASITFQVQCQSNLGSVRDHVVVNVTGVPPSGSVSISQLSPTSGPINTKVVITGSGFTPTNNNVKFGSGIITNLNSSNGGTVIEFSVPSSLNNCPIFDATLLDALPSCQIGAIVTPGVYPVSVSNVNGTSSSINFTVTAGPTEALPFETLLKGGSSISPDRASYVVRKPSEYESMWFKHFGRVSRPFVDLSNKEMLIAVFAGNKTTAGYGITIDKVLYNKEQFQLTVYVKEYIPGRGCNYQNIENQPYHIIRLNKNYASYIFNVETIAINCS